MNFETFFVNIVKQSTAASTDNPPVLELTKQDMTELTGFLEEKGVGYTQENEQEIRFNYRNFNYFAIENDKSEDVGLDGKVIEPARYEAILQTEEDQKAVEQNTDTYNVETPEANPLSESAQQAEELHEQAAAQALAGNTAEKIEEERALAQQQQQQPATVVKPKNKKKPSTAK